MMRDLLAEGQTTDTRLVLAPRVNKHLKVKAKSEMTAEKVVEDIMFSMFEEPDDTLQEAAVETFSEDSLSSKDGAEAHEILDYYFDPQPSSAPKVDVPPPVKEVEESKEEPVLPKPDDKATAEAKKAFTEAVIEPSPDFLFQL